jgi:hypothetical protein
MLPVRNVVTAALLVNVAKVVPPKRDVAVSPEEVLPNCPAITTRWPDTNGTVTEWRPPELKQRSTPPMGSINIPAPTSKPMPGIMALPYESETSGTDSRACAASRLSLVVMTCCVVPLAPGTPVSKFSTPAVPVPVPRWLEMVVSAADLFVIPKNDAPANREANVKAAFVDCDGPAVMVAAPDKVFRVATWTPAFERLSAEPPDESRNSPDVVSRLTPGAATVPAVAVSCALNATVVSEMVMLAAPGTKPSAPVTVIA